MASESNKKLSILYILNVLKEHSDAYHLLSQSEIAEYVEREYGMRLERKAVARTIDSLIDFGYDIYKRPGGGCYLIHDMETSEMTFLVDSIYSSSAIPSALCRELIEKITKGACSADRKRFNFVVKADRISRTDNKQIFYSIDIINEALSNGKQIEFTYNRYGPHKKLIKRRDKPFVVSPYFLINNRGKYYLVCNYAPHDNLSNYRMDYITDIKVRTEDARPINEIKGYEKGIDKTVYANEHIYMFSGDTVKVRLLLKDENAISEIIDWFGFKTEFFYINDQLFAEFMCNENAVVYWCLQYFDKAVIVSPLNLVNTVAQKAQKISNLYIKKDC